MLRLFYGAGNDARGLHQPSRQRRHPAVCRDHGHDRRTLRGHADSLRQRYWHRYPAQQRKGKSGVLQGLRVRPASRPDRTADAGLFRRALSPGAGTPRRIGSCQHTHLHATRLARHPFRGRSTQPAPLLNCRVTISEAERPASRQLASRGETTCITNPATLPSHSW